jgi:hypothetical protein
LDNKNSPTPASSEAQEASGADHPEKERLASKPESAGLGHFIRQAGAYSILLTCLALGVTVSAIVFSASNTRMQTELRRAQDDLEKARQENETLKIDLARRGTPSLGVDQGGSSTQRIPDVSLPKTTNELHEIEAVIETGRTVSLFGNSLRFTLLGTQFQSNPSRYVVTVSAVSPGQAVMTAQQVEVGSIIRYPATKGFDIQVLSGDALSARFLIKRNSQ